MTGKLYAKHGGVFIESGLHTSDVAELTESVKLLETENQELRDNNRRIHNEYIDVSHDREARHTVEFDTLRAEVKRLETENAKLRNAIAALIPFLMEDYDGGIMTAEYRAAIELAIAINGKESE
jgi:chaperonin cofactor prefoldin